MITEPIQLKLRPFSQTDFGRLISWVSTPETLGQWCAAFFRYPLDEDQLQRYLDSASQPEKASAGRWWRAPPRSRSRLIMSPASTWE